MVSGWWPRCAAMIALLMIVGCSSEPTSTAEPDDDDTSDDDSDEDDDDDDDTSDDDETERDAGRRDAGRDAGGSRRDSGADTRASSSDEGDTSEDSSGDDDPAGGDDTAGDDDTQMAPDEGNDDDVFYRIDKFVLKAPSLVLRLLGFETPIASDLQSALDSALASDADPADGNVDLSLLVRFVGTHDPAKEAGETTFGGAFCPFPVDPEAACHADPSSPFHYPAVSYDNAEACALEGTDQVVSGTCFQSKPARMALTLPLFGDVELDDAQVVGAWVGDNGERIDEGWVRGFLSEETAMATKLKGEVPPELGLLGVQNGTALNSFLPNAQREDGPSGAGWWFLVQFAAKPARYESAR